MLHERGHRVTVIGMQHAAVPHDYGDRPYRWLVVAEPQHRAAVDRLSALFAEADEGIVLVMQIWSMNWVAEADTGHLHVVGMSHESFDATLGSTRWERVNKYYRELDLMLVLTERDAERFELEGFNNVGVMHNALSFYPDTTSDLTSKVVVAAGRYAPEKGYDRLIAAFATVAPEHSGWQLRIFGHGPLHGRLQQQVEDAGLQGRVTVPGLAGDIEAELRASSVFALSSVHEGLPMALAEAMACGVPCVAFDCAPGVREIVTDGVDGIVVPPRNVAALAAGLRRLMADEGLRRRYGEAARRNVRKFAPDAVLEQWEGIFALLDR
jgi:glycosyltransferase involved in cell wall biosynthesis